MTRVLIAIFGLSFLQVLAGCGSGREVAIDNSGSSTARNTNAAVVGPQTNRGTDQPGVAPNAGGVGNANPDNSLMAARNRKLDSIRQAGSDASTQKTDLETVLRRSAKPAPENSEFSVALTDKLVERRTFHNNPILLRVEKIAENSRLTIKVTTTDGRTLDLPGNAIENLSVASVASILKAARIEVPISRPADRKAGTANGN